MSSLKDAVELLFRSEWLLGYLFACYLVQPFLIKLFFWLMPEGLRGLMPRAVVVAGLVLLITAPVTVWFLVYWHTLYFLLTVCQYTKRSVVWLFTWTL